MATRRQPLTRRRQGPETRDAFELYLLDRINACSRQLPRGAASPHAGVVLGIRDELRRALEKYRRVKT